MARAPIHYLNACDEGSMRTIFRNYSSQADGLVAVEPEPVVVHGTAKPPLSTVTSEGRMLPSTAA